MTQREKQLATLEIYNERFHFSAAHFTVFSEQRHEPLHGHDFAVTARIVAEVGPDGLCFDYQIVKDELEKLCQALNQRTLLPANSNAVRISHRKGEVFVAVGKSRYTLPESDVLLLPVRNISVEELSRHLLAQLRGSPTLAEHPICEVQVTVSSGIGQSGMSAWQSENAAPRT